MCLMFPWLSSFIKCKASQLMRLWYLSHRRTAKAHARLRQSLRCSHALNMEVNEGSDQTLDMQRQWIAAHACLKIEFTEGNKCHNLMSRLICRPGWFGMEVQKVVSWMKGVQQRNGIWAKSCENMSYAICEQQRRRSACASAQSDQHLYCSLLR